MYGFMSYVAMQTQEVRVMGSFSKWNVIEKIVFNGGFS